ncbi:MAG: hypothetical protein ABIJ11_02605 [Elusimicrobiota bacterium]
MTKIKENIKKLLFIGLILLVGFLFRKPIFKFTGFEIPIMKIENLFKIDIIKNERQKINNEEATTKIKRIFENADRWVKNEKRKFKEKQKNTAEEYARRMGIQQPMHAYAQLKLLKEFINSLNSKLLETNRQIEDTALKTSKGIKYLDTSWINIEKQSILETYKKIIEEEKTELKKLYHSRFGGFGNLEEELNKIE